MAEKNQQYRVLLVLFFAMVLMVTGARAHERNQSFSSFHAELTGGDLRVTVTVSVAEKHVRTYFSSRAEVSLALQEKLKVIASKPCRGTLLPVQAAPGFFRFEIKFQCEATNSLRVKNSFLLDAIPGHIHFATFHFEDYRNEAVFTGPVDHKWHIAETATEKAPAAWQYLSLGFEHILIGIDHLMFLLAILLLERRFKPLTLLITGFTVGHSISLALASLTSIQLESTLVEAFIALTIVIVAYRLYASRQEAFAFCLGLLAMAIGLAIYRLEWPVFLGLAGMAVASWFYFELNIEKEFFIHMVLTMAFGFLHGFGFAGVLADIGLEQANFILALAAFNLGIEIGQLLVVTVVIGMLFVLQRLQWLNRVTVGLQFIVIALGSYWFFDRI